jgi:hypothetical protein
VIRTSRFLPLLLIATATLAVGCRSTPDPVAPVVRDSSTFLGLAVTEASGLSDPLARASLYARIAVGYREIGDEASVASLARAALGLARSAGATEESIRTRLDLAPLLAATGDDAAALTALDAGLQFASTAPDPRTRASLLPAIVESALRSDEAARPVLRRAVDEVYVIEDPRQRVEALIAIAELYQAGDETLPVTGLIQQAIPAVRSVQDPYTRGVLFSRLAVLASATSETRLAGRLGENTLSEVDRAGPPAGDDADRLLVIVERLGALGLSDEAVSLIDLFPDAYHRAVGFSLLGTHAASYAIGLEYLRRAAEAVEGLDTAEGVEEPSRRVDIHTRIGAGYADYAATRQALAHAAAALELLVAHPEVYELIEPAGRLVALYVRLDEIQAARNLLLQAPDAYVRGTVAVRAADELITEGRLGLADDFLTVALVASDEATYLADGLRQEIVGRFARTGSIRLAIRTVERMEDELLRARSVVELAVVAEPAGLVTPIYRADLASVLAGR